MDTWFLEVAVACAAYGLVIGLFVPDLIARIPEPDPELDPGPSGAGPVGEKGAAAAEVPADMLEPKILYVDIAGARGLRLKTSLTTAVVAGLLGARVGWDPAMLFLLYLAPVGVALAVVDWHTRLLPTKVIAPSYFVVSFLAVAAAFSSGDWPSLLTAAAGWLVAGGTYLLLHLIHPRGMGLGDVRLAGVLGIALGYLGWAEMLTGVYAGFLLGGVLGLLLSLLRIVDRKQLPFGPFMLVGAVVGVLFGPAVAALY